MSDQINTLLGILAVYVLWLIVLGIGVLFPHYAMHYSAGVEKVDLTKCKIHTKKDIEEYRKKQKDYFQFIAVTGGVILVVYLLSMINN